MSSRASYRGNGGVVPAGISFTTSSTSAGALPSDHPLQAYSSSVAKPLPYPPSQAGLSTSHQAYGAASPVVTILPTASSSTRPAAGDVSSASNSAGDGGQRGYPTPAAAAAANTRADPPHVNGQQSYRSYDAPAAHRSDGAAVEAGDYEKDGGNEDEEEVDEEADYVDDDAAAAMEAEGEQAANGGQPLEYCGVRLLPGVEQLDFDEGYYVGTIDENGEMAGYGKATWHTGDTYEGEWLEGMMHGKGTYTWADGDYYHGDYVRGQMEGYGEMKDTTGLYVGEWAGDMRQGYGRMVYAGGNIYEGEWLAGMCHGTGKLIEVAANVTYEGEFNRNEKEGRGVQTNAEGDVYEGEFAKGKPNGRGTYLWSDGSRYIGMFKDGVKHGDGCEWLANGDWIAGLFQNGEHVDDNSTRHKAVQLSDDDESERGSGTDYDAEDDEDDDETAFDAHGNPIPSRRIMTKGLSDAAAAAVMAPLDPEQLRRITEPVRRPSVSISIPHRGGTVNGGTAAGGGRGTIRAANGETASATEAATPLTLALNAPQIMLDDSELEGWTSLKTIGKGSFGAVYTALLRNGRTVCCKVIELGNVENEEEMEKLRNEIALMKRLHHPNCVQYYGSLEDKTKNTLNIFMEYVSGGTLTSFVNKFNSIPLNTLRQWAYQMVTGVKYLHERGIVHRDIKGDNVLVSVDGIVKLADFGCSKSIDDVCSATHGCSTMVGTPYWMAPEVIKCEAGGYGMKSDIWSLGCTIVEMLTGKPPWPECNSMWAAVYKIANSTGLPTEIPSDVDPELMDLLEKCFERNPKLRPTAAELLKHPFLAKAAEKVSSPTASSVKGRD